MREGALPERVDAATVEIRTLGLVPPRAGIGFADDHTVVQAIRLVGPDARASESIAKQPRDGQRLVPDQFGGQAYARAPCEQPVFRVARPQVGTDGRILTVGGG